MLTGVSGSCSPRTPDLPEVGNQCIRIKSPILQLVDGMCDYIAAHFTVYVGVGIVEIDTFTGDYEM